MTTGDLAKRWRCARLLWEFPLTGRSRSLLPILFTLDSRSRLDGEIELIRWRYPLVGPSQPIMGLTRFVCCFPAAMALSLVSWSVPYVPVRQTLHPDFGCGEACHETGGVCRVISDWKSCSSEYTRSEVLSVIYSADILMLTLEMLCIMRFTVEMCLNLGPLETLQGLQYSAYLTRSASGTTDTNARLLTKYGGNILHPRYTENRTSCTEC